MIDIVAGRFIEYIRIEKANYRRNKEKSVLSITDDTEGPIFVLGNGPSLADSISKYENNLKSGKLICVNYFLMSPQAKIFKPKYCVIFDPGFFLEKDDILKDIPTVDLINKMVEEVDWDLKLILPEYAKTSYFCKCLKENSRISIYFCSDFCVDIGHATKARERRQFSLLLKDKISPPSQTVLCTALHLAILLGYKEIYLMGADMSMFKDIDVDQDDNTVFVGNKHFFDKDGSSGFTTVWCVGDLLKAYGNMFTQMSFLDRFARECGATIYNCSERSYIDAFERKKL